MGYLHSPAWSAKLKVQGDPITTALLTRRIQNTHAHSGVQVQHKNVLEMVHCDWWGGSPRAHTCATRQSFYLYFDCYVSR